MKAKNTLLLNNTNISESHCSKKNLVFACCITFSKGSMIEYKEVPKKPAWCPFIHRFFLKESISVSMIVSSNDN